MMKQSILGIVLTLTVALSAASCSFNNPDAENIPILGESTAPDTTDTPSTEEPRQPSEPYLLIGKWYAASEAMVMQFFSDGSLKLYALTPGYYEYADIYDGSYTYDGLTIQYTLGDGTSVTADCTVTEDAIRMTAYSQTLTLVPTETLPDPHPEYSYPDFEALAERLALPEGSFTGNTIPTAELYAQALENIKDQYWAEHEMPELTEGTAQTGDVVNIDYTGYLDGEAFEGGAAQDVQIKISENSGYIPGFAEGIAGHTVGETFDVPVTFPEDYGEASLAGKAVVFRMTLNCIYDRTMTDEMAVENEYESMDAWVNEVYNDLLKENIWDLIPGLSDADVPQEAYQYFYQYNLDYFHAYAFYYFQNNYERCLQYFGLTEDQILAECKEIARRYLQGAQIVAHFGLTPDAELTEQLTEEFIADYMSSGYTREEAEAALENEGKAEFRATLLAETAEVYLLANNTFAAQE